MFFSDFPSEIIIIPILFIGLPWLVLHYMTKWKQSATITTDDEHLLDDLYQLAKRLDDRMETVERLVAADHPEFKSTRMVDNRELEGQSLAELDRLVAENNAAKAQTNEGTKR